MPVCVTDLEIHESNYLYYVLRNCYMCDTVLIKGFNSFLNMPIHKSAHKTCKFVK